MIIVKIGGGKSALDNLDNILRDFSRIKEKKILIHGANYEMEIISEKLGHKNIMLTSVSGHVSRRTDRKTLEILEMVYSGLSNKRIVEKLHRYCVNAIGLTGMDAKIWLCKRKPFVKARVNGKIKIIRDDYTGKVVEVNTKLLNMLLENGYTPVLTIPGISYENEAVNLDNDRALAITAAKMRAEKVVILLEARGILRNKDDENSLIKKMNLNDIEEALSFTQGRMRKKILAIKEALNYGVKKIYVSDLRNPEPITSALRGEGTKIEQ